MELTTASAMRAARILQVACAPVIWSGVMGVAERVFRHERGESRLRLPDTLAVGQVQCP
ncbi:MAG TPA: hypothetical protein VKK19_05740 [Candidatus Dormibacteraeota bacterium]|nr:hypothetical protein [Candidatus Dormibacteraeota bacterium]